MTDMTDLLARARPDLAKARYDEQNMRLQRVGKRATTSQRRQELSDLALPGGKFLRELREAKRGR